MKRGKSSEHVADVPVDRGRPDATKNRLAGLLVRTAGPADSDSLLALQMCQRFGGGVQFSEHHEPDFFHRMDVVPDCTTYVACVNGRVVGCAANSVRQVRIGGRHILAGYEFAYLVDSDYRGLGVAGALHRQIAADQENRGISFSYALIDSGNEASQRVFARDGFTEVAVLAMDGLRAYRPLREETGAIVRVLAYDDYPAAVRVFEQTWAGSDFHQALTEKTWADMAEQRSGMRAWVMEEEGRIVACLGVWNRARVKIVEELPPYIAAVAPVLREVSRLSHTPRRIPAVGEKLRHWHVIVAGFSAPGQMATLLRRANNEALAVGADQIVLLGGEQTAIREELSGFSRIVSSVSLYARATPQDGVDCHASFFSGLDW